MKPWLKTISLPHPIRSARLRGATPVPSAQPSLSEAEQKEKEEAAYQRGRADGERALSAQLLHQRNEIQQLQLGVLTSLQQSLPDLIRQSEPMLVDLALEVARKIISDIPISKEMVEAAIQEALSHVEETTEFHILLHPEDHALLVEGASSFLSHQPAGVQMHLQASRDISRGGCVVQTKFGIIDARRETKLELVKQSLKENA